MPDAPQHSLPILGDSCFVAGTPIRTSSGSIAIEHIQPRDLVLSRPEKDEHALARPQRVEEVFVLQAPVVTIELGGQAIKTTAEHPVYVAGRGWVPIQNLAAGDLILGEDGNTTPVTAVYATGRTETVYIFRVAEDHTYFVGTPDWGFSLWVHNSYSVDNAGNVVDDAGKTVGKIEVQPDGSAIYKSSNGNAEYRYGNYDAAVRDAENGFPNNGLGALVKVNSNDPAADALANKIGGESSVRFSNGPNNEFDAVSDMYIAQSKPAGMILGQAFRNQLKKTFEVALHTGRIPYFHFEGPPDPSVLRKIQEYSLRYGVQPVIDISPLP